MHSAILQFSQKEAMTTLAALDVSKTSTSIHVVDEKGACVWGGKVLTDPDALAAALSPFADDLALTGLETGCWTDLALARLDRPGLPDGLHGCPPVSCGPVDQHQQDRCQ